MAYLALFAFQVALSKAQGKEKEALPCGRAGVSGFCSRSRRLAYGVQYLGLRVEGSVGISG